MTGRQLTAFEHILLGLICLSPASGYDLKRIFAATPMGLYQPSSGALYPALRRLERKGLVQVQAPSSPGTHGGHGGHGGQSARPRHVYESTQAGQTTHLAWLRTPIEPATASRDLGLHLMRFVMMETQLPPEEILAFLRNLADALAVLTAQLEHFTNTDDRPTGHPRLALDHGLAVHKASLQWAERTIAVLGSEFSPGPGRRG